MAHVLIVHAHPEPGSFSSALAQTARAVLTAEGHEVEFSDLYAQQFNPVSDRRNFTTTADPAYLKQQVEEAFATQHAGFSPELEEEMRKLERCDLLIFSFPLWWFGLPAILKGWVDRVIAYKRFYGGGVWYDLGKGRGKRAMIAMTTGGEEQMFGSLGLHPALEDILRPIHQGILWFNGYSPLPPFVAYAAGRVTDAKRQEYLEAWRERLPALFDEAPLRYPSIAEFDPETFVDTVPRFMVTVTRTKPVDDAYLQLVSAEIEHVQALRRDRSVLQAHFAPLEAEPWRGFLLLRAKSADEVQAVCQKLPARRLSALRGEPSCVRLSCLNLLLRSRRRRLASPGPTRRISFKAAPCSADSMTTQRRQGEPRMQGESPPVFLRFIGGRRRKITARRPSQTYGR